MLFQDNCEDTDDGRTDSLGNTCTNAIFNKFPSLCGKTDDDDFVASAMCCACKGNTCFCTIGDLRLSKFKVTLTY